MRILIVEDDHALSRLLVMTLEKENLFVDHTASGEQALEYAKRYEYDLIVLDLSLPDIGGEAVLSALRKDGNDTPVLVLTGNAKVESKLTTFEIGADDYLSKPFDKSELKARIKAIIRRSKGHAASTITVNSEGDFTINLDTKTANYRDQPIPLTPKEYQLIELLALRQGRVLSRDFILEHFYSGIDEPNSKIVEVFVSKLRRKLKEAGVNPDVVKTMRGYGYCIEPTQNGIV